MTHLYYPAIWLDLQYSSFYFSPIAFQIAKLNMREQLDVIYVDFIKAFNSVSHSRLLIKVHWNQLLVNHYQRVQVRIVMYYQVSHKGASQLQGHCYSQFTSPESVNFSTLYLFADDTKCLKSINTPEDVVKLWSDIYTGVLIGICHTMRPSSYI